MKTILRLFFTFFLIQPIFVNPLDAVEVTERNEYLFDVRGDDGDVYRNNISLRKELKSPEISLSAFCEAQWNFKTDEWEKLMLGAETGKCLWRYLYISQSIQFISGQILDYMVFDVNNKSLDATTRLALQLPLLRYFSMRLFEEYSINLEKGRNGSNEVGTEFIYDFKDRLSLGLGWRHTDRIHSFDTDYITSFVTLRF